MTNDSKQPQQRDASQRVAFLLSQVGIYSANRFALRLEELELQPGDVGILRVIAAEEGLSQQALADILGVVPSRVVVLIDDLQKKELVSRERSARDRRTYELRLTTEGKKVMRRMRTIGAAHEAEITSALTNAEREHLAALLGKIAKSHELTPDVLPGYRQSHR
ncbi:MarR family winged helix-turn-helix transcriptional regulator [Brevibacterium sp. FME37]|uniref:MarR family winged helix-turn-helix transcriptional regulator n=1 Tax=Brevibacterium sp. FME37 TaxID=2742607 RepID=UPI00186615BA|nr:MarR family transcriptional regulator [Brevibacterium sp. FME37]